MPVPLIPALFQKVKEKSETPVSLTPALSQGERELIAHPSLLIMREEAKSLPTVATGIEPFHHLRQHHIPRQNRHQPWEVAQRQRLQAQVTRQR